MSIVGRLTSADDRGLGVESDGGDEVLIPLENVLSLERSIARRRNTRRGALAGLAVGAVLGGAVGLGLDPYSDCGGAAGEGECRFWLAGAALFGAVGAGLGAVAGHAVQSDVWQEVPMGSLRTEDSPGRTTRLVLSWSVGLP